MVCSKIFLRDPSLAFTVADDCQVLFLGACLHPGAPVMFVTEYMPKGAMGGWDGRSNPG